MRDIKLPTWSVVILLVVGLSIGIVLGFSLGKSIITSENADASTGTNEVQHNLSIDCGSDEYTCTYDISVSDFGTADAVYLTSGDIGYVGAKELTPSSPSATVTIEGNYAQVFARYGNTYKLVDYYHYSEEKPDPITESSEPTPQENAVAGVDISQNSTHLKITVVSMDSSDKVYVNDSSGNNQATLNRVGQTESFKHDGSGSEYVVIAALDGTQNVVQTYTVQ